MQLGIILPESICSLRDETAEGKIKAEEKRRWTFAIAIPARNHE
jgi:hypothetical protein